MKIKGTSSHHRSENIYRFKTFSELLANVNVDVARRVQKLSATPEDADTFFSQSLDKWSELNCTEHFTTFRRQVTGKVQSLPLLVHHQKEILDLLCQHLRVPNSLAYGPLLDLVVQLARDLQSDFYKYFESVLTVLVTLLQVHHHDVSILEQVFSCLSYLFKFLWRTMIADIHNVYGLFAPLLSDEYRDYINNFAAESFAFLMRKAKDFSLLCQFMFADLEQHPDRVAGLGRLMFESIKGVQKQFHTSAASMVSGMLEALGVTNLPVDLVSQCLEKAWLAMAQYTKRDHMTPIWDVLLGHISAVYEEWRAGGEMECQHNLHHSLHLLNVWVTYKGGVLILSAGKIAQMLTEMLTSQAPGVEFMEALLLATSQLVTGQRVTLTMQEQSLLLHNVYKCQRQSDLIHGFSTTVLHLPLFEKDVLPHLLEFCGRCITEGNEDEREAATLTLAKVILHKAPSPLTTDEMAPYTTYLLDFGSQAKRSEKLLGDVPKKLIDKLQKLIDDFDFEDLPLVWAIVICLPHIRPLNKKVCCRVVTKLLNKMIDVSGQSQLMCDETLCVLCEAAYTLMTLYDSDTFFSHIPVTVIIDLLRRNRDNVHSLRLAALYFARASILSVQSVLTVEIFEQIFPLIQEGLCSPYARVRMLTLQICCEFDLPMPALPEDLADLEQIGVFRICLEAEKIEAGVHTYRGKLVFLRRLDNDVVKNQVPLGGYEEVALRYLLGNLYVNLTLMWGPIRELIMGHATGPRQDVFWKVFSQYLNSAAAHAEESVAGEQKVVKVTQLQPSEEKNTTSILEKDSTDEAFHCRISDITGSDRVDHQNFRNQMWKTMHHFPRICEAKSRIIVPLFFRFLENEYYPANVSTAPTQDLSKRTLQEEGEDQEEEEEVEEDEEQDTSQTEVSSGKKAQKKGQKVAKNKPRRAPNATLVVHLTLFSKWHTPKSVHGEPRLRELYFDLMSHRSPFVQKVAFECILTYKYKYLTPYRENFERLMDDKTFKNEIILFGISMETSVVAKEHREDLLPIVMALLYGKMQTKAGKDTTGRAHAQQRKGVILRFLAGCEVHEFKIFLDLVFKPFKHFLGGDTEKIFDEVVEDVDLTKVIPLRKQQGLLNTVEVVITKLGSLLSSYIPSLLRIVVCVLGQVVNLLAKREDIHRRAITGLKAVRQVALSQLNLIFKTFDRYPFSEAEISVVFQAAVWPKLELLVTEGLYSPTGLLEIFLTWTQHKRYHGLLIKSLVDNNFNLLPFVFRLLAVERVNEKVVNVIMQMVQNLLRSSEEEEEEEDGEEMVPVFVGPTIELAGSDDLPQGMRILLPHVSAILDHIRKVVEVMLAQKGRIKSMPLRELNILAKLSDHVKDKHQSDKVVLLLLPFLSRNLNRSPDIEVAILQAVCHLVRKSPQPVQFLPSMSELFSSLSARGSRVMLCQALQAVAEGDPSIKDITEIVTQLNSWDRRYVEEPDYLARLDAFNLAKTMIQTPGGTHYTTLLTMLIHNCTFFLSNLTDMSMRDTASRCLQEIVKCVARQPEDEALFQNIIRKTIIPQVKFGLKLQAEAGRHEFINLVAELVKQFPMLPVFDDLTKLTDPDPEADFFANMVHIQMYRRARAIRRITRVLNNHTFRAETFMMYLLPMVTAYVRDEAYLKHSVMVDAAVETIGGICLRLPWARYQVLLKHYLNQLPKSLDNQKMMVRLVVAVLDGFHFDLKNATVPAALQQGAPPKNIEDKGEKKEDKGGDCEESVVKEGDEGDDVEDEVMEESGESEEGVMSPTQSRVIMCPEVLATRIHRYIVKTVLPQLHKCLTRKSKSDSEHKKAKAGKYAEDEEILRVPIALAMVKLLQNLPERTLNINLPSILLRVCQFLKSRSIDIRNTARDTLVKVLQALGPPYLRYILKEMRSALKRGYQIHVLTYTVHTLLVKLEPSLQAGDLNNCVEPLVEVFNDELFGETAAEKEVVGITSNLMEARSSKSFDSYTLLAKFITTETLAKIMTPLKEVLEKTNSRRITNKVEDVLQRVMVGIGLNTSLELSDLLTFIYGLTTEVMPMLQPKKDETPGTSDPDPREKPPSTYLLAKVTPRGGHKPKTHFKTNMHVLIQFGLQVLNMLLKQSKLLPTDRDHIKMVDPFIPMLTDCLRAKHIKVTSASLRCLIWLLKFPLPTLDKKITAITNSLFVLLNTYAVAGAAKGDNFDLVDMTFKAVTVRVRDMTHHAIGDEHLQVLLSYAQQDIHDHGRQATAFTLLKALLSRKRAIPEMVTVMKKVEKLSITAENAQTRHKCRQVCAQFLMNYPLGLKAVQSHLEFYITQLDYEHEMGRESAIEMMANMFETFPKTVVEKNSGFFFIPLASSLVNDDSTKCRKLVALALKKLLNQLDIGKRDELFNICLKWLQEDKVAVRKLGALTCGLVVEVEVVQFQRHLTAILPVIEDQINPNNYEESETEGEEREMDQLLYSLLNLLLEVVTKCDVLRKDKWDSKLQPIWGHLEKFLTFPHAWVRLATAQLFGSLFASWQPEELARSSSKGEDMQDTSSYLKINTMEKLHTLCGAMTTQLASPLMDQLLADQIVKNLVFLGKVLHHLPDTTNGEPPAKARRQERDPVTRDLDPDVVEEEQEKTTSLSWLIRRLCREARTEAAANHKVTIKRTSVFKWLAAVAMELGSTDLPRFLPSMLPVLVREITDHSPHANAELKALTQEVIDLMKNIAGGDVFTQQYASMQKHISEKRENRKREKVQLMVSNPAVAAKRKMKKNLAKQVAKKRRVEEYRPIKKLKKH